MISMLGFCRIWSDFCIYDMRFAIYERRGVDDCRHWFDWAGSTGGNGVVGGCCRREVHKKFVFLCVFMSKRCVDGGFVMRDPPSLRSSATSE